MPVVRRACALALLVISLTACTSSDPEEPEAAPSPTATTLGDLATEDLTVVRGEFCERVDAGSVEDALGGEPDDTATWRNGDRARVAPGVKDVVHEYGCAWTTRGAAARAWVFAPPVSPASARQLGRATASGQRCAEVADPEPFGRRTVAVTCRSGDGPTTTYQGLFGDAWLSCSLSGSDAEATARWCLAVARAAAA